MCADTRSGEAGYKRLTLCNPGPGGTKIPPKQLILEARHLRSNASRPRDLYAIEGGIHAKDDAMDVVYVFVSIKILLITLILKLGFCSTTSRKQQVH